MAFDLPTGARFAIAALTELARPAIALPMTQDQSDDAQIAAMSFEEALRALEGVVRQLESGEVPLDQSISLYEKGEKLRAACQARLDAASARIERIVAGSDGQPATRPLDAG